MRVVLAGVVALSLCGASVACRSTGGGLGAAIERSKSTSDSTQITVKVENHSFWDVNLYAIEENGNRTRLGTVTGNLTASLVVPPNLVVGGAALRFVADPIGGGRRSSTDRVYLQPGDEVTLTVPAM